MGPRKSMDFGKEVPCKGRNCGQPVILIDLIVKGEMRRVCLDAVPVFMYVPFFEKSDANSQGPKRPIKWQKRLVFRSHQEVCVNAVDFNPHAFIGGNS